MWTCPFICVSHIRFSLNASDLFQTIYITFLSKNIRYDVITYQRWEHWTSAPANLLDHTKMHLQQRSVKVRTIHNTVVAFTRIDKTHFWIEVLPIHWLRILPFLRAVCYAVVFLWLTLRVPFTSDMNNFIRTPDSFFAQNHSSLCTKTCLRTRACTMYLWAISSAFLASIFTLLVFQQFKGHSTQVFDCWLKCWKKPEIRKMQSTKFELSRSSRFQNLSFFQNSSKLQVFLNSV